MNESKDANSNASDVAPQTAGQGRQHSEDPPRKEPPSLLFRLVIPITFAFVFSCFLILTHDLWGDQNGAFGKFLQKYGTSILGFEASAAIVMAVVAMTVDRLQTLRAQRDVAEASTVTPETSDE